MLQHRRRDDKDSKNNKTDRGSKSNKDHIEIFHR